MNFCVELQWLQSDPWIHEEKIFIFFHSENQLKKKKLHITEYSHTLVPRSDEVMKFCVEAAVTAVGPPPPLK